MNQLAIHLRKDLKLLTSDSLFVIFILLLVAVSFVLALTAGNSYRYSVGGWSGIVTKHSIDAAQISSLNQYWSTVLSFESVVFLALSAMAMSQDKETGMLGYILTFRTNKKMFFISKFLIILMMVAIGIVVAVVVYLIVFSMMDVPLLALDTILASMIFPAALLIVLSSIGLLLSTILKKKSLAMVIAILLFSALSIMQSFVTFAAINAAYLTHPGVEYSELVQYAPIEYKLLIWANPLMLLDGGRNLMSTGDQGSSSLVWLNPEMSVVAAVLMTAFYLLLGLVFFSRERREKPSLIGSLVKKLLKGKSSSS